MIPQGFDQSGKLNSEYGAYSREASEFMYGSGGVSKESEEDGVKLFVGQIPKDMNEEMLRPFFLEFGPILELTIIRDKSSKLHRGCAFLTYARKQSAIRAIQTLHDKIKLPNALNPLQIRPAESQSERENKIFVGMLPKTITELDLHDMFARYGQLKEIHIIRGPEGQSKGCAFVKFLEREAALLAIHEMNETIPEGSTRPLVIKFADSKKSGRANQPEFGDKDDVIISSQGVDRSLEEYWAAQAQASSMNPQGAKGLSNVATSTYSYPVQSMNVSPMLHSSIPQIPYMPYSPGSPVAPSYVYYGGYYSPYGVEAGLQQLQLSPGRSRANSKPLRKQFNPENSGRMDSEQVHVSESSGHSSHQSHLVDHSDDANGKPAEGPPGANIFIYHLPRDLTDADLATLFAPFGNVISAKVYVDKRTAESKGFGFVSYDLVDSAENAITAMNGFQIGTKRLKVQHKRTNSGSYSSTEGSYGVPASSVAYPMVSQVSHQQVSYPRTIEEQQHMLSVYNAQVAAYQHQHHEQLKQHQPHPAAQNPNQHQQHHFIGSRLSGTDGGLNQSVPSHQGTQNRASESYDLDVAKYPNAHFLRKDV